MLFVDVHCDDEIDRRLLIPLHKVDEVHINADGDDWILVGEKVYVTKGLNGFYESVVDIVEAETA